jgi:uncharacterized protein YbjT (DUF2867 family)
MILVTSALGNQGHHLLPRLSAKRQRVRAVDIDPEGPAKLEALGASEGVCADLMDGAAMKSALQDVRTVYHIGPNGHPREEEMGKQIIDLARMAEVQHFIYSSVLHPQIDALSQHTAKLKVEQHLIESGLNFTILQPAHYMQTLQHRSAFSGGPFRLTWSLERYQSLIDVDDITEVVAKVIKEGEIHYGATYELSSADCLTASDIAERIGRVTGRVPPLEEVSPARVIASVFGEDHDRERFERRVRLFEVVARWYSEHDFVGNSRVATMLLGRKPNSYETFLVRDYAVWAKEAEPR